jgi:endo-1,4-beta-xylanase
MKHLFLILLLPFSSLIHSQNLITNGDFESDLTSWEDRVANTDYTATFNVSTTDIHNGSKAALINVTKVKSDYWAFRYHNIRMRQSGFTGQRGDIFTLKFWAKIKNAGEAHPMIQAGIARNATEKTDFWILEDYDMSNFWIDETWKEYTMDLILTKDVGSDIALLIRFGGMTGEYYIDDISLEKTGSFPEPNWLENAQSRIDTLRKGNLEFTILDKEGTIMPDATIDISLTNHNFQWGTAVRSVSTSSFYYSQPEWERQEVKKFLNTIVNENDFKWPQTEGTQGNVNYNNIDLYLNWKDTANIMFRGHCLYWTKEVYMPSWWTGLSKNDKISALQTRCTRDVNYYKGKVLEYDVVNEPVHFPYVEDECGEDIYYKTFDWANQADSQAKLYVNDWWNIDKWDSWRLRQWVEKRQLEGTPIHGIGLQAHWDNERIDWMEIVHKMNYLAQTDLPLKLT